MQLQFSYSLCCRIVLILMLNALRSTTGIENKEPFIKWRGLRCETKFTNPYLDNLLLIFKRHSKLKRGDSEEGIGSKQNETIRSYKYNLMGTEYYGLLITLQMEIFFNSLILTFILKLLPPLSKI